jgi:hypothetical protein
VVRGQRCSIQPLAPQPRGVAEPTRPKRDADKSIAWHLARMSATFDFRYTRNGLVNASKRDMRMRGLGQRKFMIRSFASSLIVIERVRSVANKKSYRSCLCILEKARMTCPTASRSIGSPSLKFPDLTNGKSPNSMVYRTAPSCQLSTLLAKRRPLPTRTSGGAKWREETIPRSSEARFPSTRCPVFVLISMDVPKSMSLGEGKNKNRHDEREWVERDSTKIHQWLVAMPFLKTQEK